MMSYIGGSGDTPDVRNSKYIENIMGEFPLFKRNWTHKDNFEKYVENILQTLSVRNGIPIEIDVSSIDKFYGGISDLIMDVNYDYRYEMYTHAVRQCIEEHLNQHDTWKQIIHDNDNALLDRRWVPVIRNSD